MSNHTRPVPKEDYPSLRKSERLHVGVLQERRDYLRRRLAEGDHSEGAGPFLAGEASAIEWTLEQIDQHYGLDQVDGISKDDMAVAMLESICDADDTPERSLEQAREILLSVASDEVRQAYERVVECQRWAALT